MQTENDSPAAIDDLENLKSKNVFSTEDFIKFRSEINFSDRMLHRDTKQGLAPEEKTGVERGI